MAINLYEPVGYLASLLVLATFALPIFMLKLFDNGFNVVGAVVVFAFYFCQYSVIIFFNSALVGAATIRLEGGDPSFSDGLRIARSRLGAILGYAAIAATVGLILQSLKNRENNIIVRLIGSGLGVAWTLATFLVVVSQALLRRLPITECGCFGGLLAFPLHVVLVFDLRLLAVVAVLWLHRAKSARSSLDSYFAQQA